VEGVHLLVKVFPLLGELHPLILELLLRHTLR
jgi:hypothetical protein